MRVLIESGAEAEVSRDAIFTIVSKNYLHYARTLMESVRIAAPTADRHVILCDRPDGGDLRGEIFTVTTIGELPLPRPDRFVFQYTQLEVNTAVKAWVFALLFDRGYERVIFFDPDICVYASLEPILGSLDAADVLLTPHLTGCLDDNRHPSELQILQSGTYNLGFLALRNGAVSQQLLGWWKTKLLRDCVVDIPRGLFVDQKWIDLVPGMFERVKVIRNPGWNVAYWNLLHRKVDGDAGRIRVNGEPLVFFHFSGYDPDTSVISKHQNRFTLADLCPSLRSLFREYAIELQANGRDECVRREYGFARLADGVLIPDVGRALYRQEIPWGAEHPPLDSLEGAGWVRGFLNEPARARRAVPFTRLAEYVYRLRPDLQHAFPDLYGVDALAYAEWYVASATREVRIDDVFVQPVRDAISDQLGSNEEAAPEDRAATIAGRSAPPDPSRSAFRTLYRIASKVRPHVTPITTQRFRKDVRRWLLRHAYGPSGSYPDTSAANGINIVGYLHAESGVGESARACIRAAVAGGCRVAAIDFREGNISRMDEAPLLGLPSDPRHAVNLFHINADQIELAYASMGPGIYAQRHNIGFWAWELPEFPPEWETAFACVDEIWTPSSFCQQAIAQRSPVPVSVMPHCVAVPGGNGAGRHYFGIRDNAFTFLSVFDALSVFERKNPIGVISAYRKAFGNSSADTQLVIKVSNSEYAPEAIRSLRDAAARDPSVVLIDKYLSRPELVDLMRVCDCTVSLHRSEGFGLVLAESMAIGTPVIATAWSGNMDFMDVGNALLVDFQLVTLERDYGPYKRGQTWAEPDIAHAAGLMHHAKEDTGSIASLTRRAQATMSERFSPQAIGRRIRQRLEVIDQYRQWRPIAVPAGART